MKLYISLLFLFSSILGITQEFKNADGDTHLWGTIQVDQFKKAPYADWYFKHYDDHQSSLTVEDGTAFQDMTVKVFLGTWCGDTKYLLPRFIKNWEHLGLSMDQVEFIGLHNDGDLYKQGPNQETNDYNIHRVPTFIFEKDGQEMNRIVERTVFDLDTDMKKIAANQAYHPRYRAVSIVNDIINQQPVDSLFTKDVLNTTFAKIRREVSTSSELNTYGYVLSAQDKSIEAEFAFKLNRHLFPYNPNVRDSYGEILLANEKLEMAQAEYYEALRLKQEDSHIIKQLVEIDKLLAEEASEEEQE